MRDGIFYKLNHEQWRAVSSDSGNLLINAGAGTGKTTTIASRILYLQLAKDVDPSAIWAVSFSRSAKEQIEKKLEELCLAAGRGGLTRTFTFHGLAYRIVRLAAFHGQTWLRPGFEVKESSFETVRNLCPKEVESWVELCSQAIDRVRQGHPDLAKVCMSPDDLPPSKQLIFMSPDGSKQMINTDQIKRLWNKYLEFKKRRNFTDYPGLITEAIHIMRTKTRVREEVLEGLKYLFVDEYQDTSRAQEQLLFEFAHHGVELTVVGDSEQSIYGFNGSDVSNILNFAERLGEMGLHVLPPVDLTENCRSAPNILELANRIVSPKTKKLKPFSGSLPEPLESHRKKNDLVRLVDAPRLDLAVEYVCEEINRLIHQEETAPGDIAVLVRKNSTHSPHGDRIKERLESKGIPVGIIKKKAAYPEDVLNEAEELCQEHYLSDISDLINTVETSEVRLPPHLQKPILKLLMDAREKGVETGGDVLDHICDLRAKEEEQDSEGVQVRTVHSAKGMEFPVVFLLYVRYRDFPHGSFPNVEEERRLFYVGITRAMKRLYIIGHGGLHHVDFFSECRGPGTMEIDYSVPDSPRIKHNNSSRMETQEELIREQQESYLNQRRAELRRLFEEDDW